MVLYGRAGLPAIQANQIWQDGGVASFEAVASELPALSEIRIKLKAKAPYTRSDLQNHLRVESDLGRLADFATTQTICKRSFGETVITEKLERLTGSDLVRVGHPQGPLVPASEASFRATYENTAQARFRILFLSPKDISSVAPMKSQTSVLLDRDTPHLRHVMRIIHLRASVIGSFSSHPLPLTP